jgi:diguanylate cyclase (GGDEF)-like protein
MRPLSICALVLAVLSIGIGCLLVEARRSHDEATARSTLTALAENHSAGMVAYYSEIRADLATAAGSPAVQRLADGARGASTLVEASRSLATLEDSLQHALDRLAIVNLYGETVLLRSEGHPAHPLPVSMAARLSTPIELGDMSASVPYLTPKTRTPVIAFSMLTSSQNTAHVVLEIPMTELLQQLRGPGSAARLRLIEPERRVVVVDSTGSVGSLPVPRELSSVMSSVESVGTMHDGRAVTAFVRPTFLGPGLSGTIGDWLLTATNPIAVPTIRESIGPASVALVVVGLLVLVLAVLGLRASARRLERLASTDSLTSLGNRRQLLRDLSVCFKATSGPTPWTLVLLDLDGFKAYNDAFGHAGGDNLLRRLAGRLEQFACEQGATAYRLGGDEFCVLAPTNASDVVGRWAETALSERGEAFSVKASWGVAQLPGEARTPAKALKLADERMYVQKAGGRSSAARQITEVVVSLLDEQQPGCAARVCELADLTEAVGTHLGLPNDELLDLRRATLLHRVGLSAVPSTILEKEQPLTSDELDFIREHTVVAERVLAAAPSLRGVAMLVRATSEAFDGSGRPDGLCGAQIPLASRVIAVCAAYAAMTEPRPYRPARSHMAAVVELQRCAGSQFDPDVVAVLDEIFHAEAAEPADRRTSLSGAGVPARAL